MAEKKSPERMFEVVVSFDGLNVGERFSERTAADLAWAQKHVETGYLLDVTEEPTAREAQHGGSEGQG